MTDNLPNHLGDSLEYADRMGKEHPLNTVRATAADVYRIYAKLDYRMSELDRRLSAIQHNLRELFKELVEGGS